ncbi:MAG: aminoacyl-tRNA hydrolase [Anaerolineae bacterium]|nr:aminoacyl-tRNA hydrolase [Anaerolineae bacterium]
MFLIVGLGNPGREYLETRHNVGFMAVDRLCQKWGVKPNRLQSKSLIAQALVDEDKVILVKPQTFMNLSGQAVAPLMRYYKLELSQILVIHDDLDLPLGTIRLRPSGGSGGQKGLASIIQQVGTQDFPRLRIGIGRPPGRMEAADYVLQSFSKGDMETLQFILPKVEDAVHTFLKQGIVTAMNQFNGALEGSENH